MVTARHFFRSLVGVASIVLATAALSAVSPAAAHADAGSESADALLSSLHVAAPQPTGYSRSLFGSGWDDPLHDGCDTRADVLKAGSSVPVTFTTPDGCTVSTGQWTSWYDDQSYTDASALQIDHLVPLGEAWASGAFAWTPQQRVAYYNNLLVPYALQAVTSAVNESKGDDDPAKWMPPAADAACQYVTDWILVKYEWSLTIDSAEKSAIQGDLDSGSCGSTIVSLPAVQIAAGAVVARISGADRYATAVQLSSSYSPGVPVVYIASGAGFADALSAAPAAAAAGGPLLLTSPTSLPDVVKQELTRLQPQRIVVVGGPGAVSEAVFDELSPYATDEVDRVSGADRYATSQAIVRDAFIQNPVNGIAGVNRVYLASGLNFPDALSASAAAGAVHGAVLLVNGSASSLDQNTTDLISAVHPSDLVIAGGTGVISDAMAASASALGLPGGTKRLSGADRYQTSQAIDDDAFPSAQVVYVASGLNYPDALAGAAVAGNRDAPLFLAPGTCVTPSIGTDIQSLDPEQLNLIGGASVLSDDVGALLPCAITPTVSATVSCASTPVVTYQVSNANSFAVSVTMAGGNSSDDVSVAPSSSASGTLNAPAEDTSELVTATFRGALIYSASVHRDCTAPPPPPPVTPPSGPAPAQGVHPGAYCSTPGALGYTDKGTLMICSTTPSDSRYRWRAA